MRKWQKVGQGWIPNRVGNDVLLVGNDVLLVGNDVLLVGNDVLLVGNDVLLVGNDVLLVGNDVLLVGNDVLLVGNDGGDGGLAPVLASYSPFVAKCGKGGEEYLFPPAPPAKQM